MVRTHFGDRGVSIPQRPHGEHQVVLRVKTIAEELAEIAGRHDPWADAIMASIAAMQIDRQFVSKPQFQTSPSPYEKSA
jgi:hypothetical protein